MEFIPISKNHLKIVETWLPELGNYYDGHKDSKFFDQIANKEKQDPFGYFTQKKEIWSATENGDLLGFVCLNFKRGGSIKIGPIMVNPRFRGRGVGKYLISNSVLRGKELGSRKIFATTSSLNIPATQMFESLGFSKEASLPNQYRDNTEEYIWGLFLISPKPTNFPKNSLLTVDKETEHEIRKYQMTDREYLENVVELMTEWHDDLDDGFVEGIVKATERQLDFEIKGKEVFVSGSNGIQTGIAVTTPKRGGPIKVYPLTGSPSAQTNLVKSIKEFYTHKEYKKLYTFSPSGDNKHIKTLEKLGFTQRGILKSPYKDGYNLTILDLQL